MSAEHEHLSDETLMDYADDRTAAAGRVHVETHLASCSMCRAKLEEYSSFATALRDEETWWALKTIVLGETVNNVHAFNERLAREDAEAERLLRHLLDSQYVFLFANVARKLRFRTGGVARLLTTTARSECDRNARFAVVLAETAAMIAEALPDDYYPAQSVNVIRGNAWIEFATACRYLARFDKGFDALGRAERAYRRLPTDATHLGRVFLARAVMFFEQQKYEEALPLARQAAERFRMYGLLSSYLDAKELEAVTLYRMGDTRATFDVYQRIYDTADVLGEVEKKARAARNLAVAHADRGEISTASTYLQLALQIYAGLGQPAMVAHTRWSIAWLALLAGDARAAAEQLPAVVNDLSAFGMAGDAARAQLDLAEALIVLERFDEVRDICAALVSYFRRANMLTGAVTAAAFLKEAAAKRRIVREDVKHVRRYLDALNRQPDLVFIPPSDDRSRTAKN
jgi:tetratricopeptide (TPR) repeat protein